MVSSAAGPPELTPRWFFARDNGWAIFSDEDDARLEERWHELGGNNYQVQPNGVFTVSNSQGDIRSSTDDPGASEDEAKDASHGQGSLKKCSSQGSTETQDDDHDDKRFLWSPPSGVDELKSKISSLFSTTARTGAKEQQERQAKELGVDRVHDMGNGKIQVDHKQDPDKEEPRWKVPVLEDALFDADVRAMVMYPAFFKGALVRIIRATYFYSSLTDGSYVPVAYFEPLAHDLERIYQEVRPWEKASIKDDDDKQQQGDHEPPSASASDSERLKAIPIPSMRDQAGEVVWETGSLAKIFTGDFSGKLLSVVGGSRIVRGFTTADAIARKRSNQSFLNNLQTAAMPWSGLRDEHDHSSEDDATTGHKDKSAQQKTEKKEKGETVSSRWNQWRFGAAKLPDANPDAPDAEQEPSSSGFSERVWPSSEDSYWLYPVHAVQRLWYGQEDQEPTRSDATAQTVRGEPSRSEPTHDKINREQDREPSKSEQAEEEAQEVSSDEPHVGSDKSEGAEKADYSNAPPHLVLCIHGIGQQLAADFDAISFTYDVESLRNQSKKLAKLPELQALGQGQRLQFLPINWRQGLDFDAKPAGNDNFFNLSDINSPDSIPFVRQVISKVLLDIPLYLSPHKARSMIPAVRDELNRIYRLYVKRNPSFEKEGGRVSIIGHSLGSALTIDLLSAQPTRVPLLHEYKGKDDLYEAQTSRLLFNTANTFLIGSPTALFLYLEGAQLIARRGTARTIDEDLSASQEGSDAHHCSPATETLSNCRHISDPICFAPLGATVEKAYAQLLRSVTMETASNALVNGQPMVPLSITELFKKFDHPFALANYFEQQPPNQEAEGSDKIKQKAQDAGKTCHKDPDLDNLMQQVLRGQKRFEALSPLGLIDFTMGDAGLTEYLDMLSAHTSYWTSKDFSRFVLSVIYSYGPKQQLALVPEHAHSL